LNDVNGFNLNIDENGVVNTEGGWNNELLV